MESKSCAKCGQCKPLTEFSRRGGYSMKGSPRLNANCKECRKNAARQAAIGRQGGQKAEVAKVYTAVPTDDRPISDRLLDAEMRMWVHSAEPGVAPQARAY